MPCLVVIEEMHTEVAQSPRFSSLVDYRAKFDFKPPLDCDIVWLDEGLGVGQCVVCVGMGNRSTTSQPAARSSTYLLLVDYLG